MNKAALKGLRYKEAGMLTCLANFLIFFPSYLVLSYSNLFGAVCQVQQENSRSLYRVDC